MKLELKHLAPYLPYSLKAIFKERNEKYCRKYVIGTISAIYSDSLIVCHDTIKSVPNKFKPILRPLSDLMKEIEVNGEKIIPIIELAKIHGIEFEIKEIKIQFYTIVCNSEIALHPTDNTAFSRYFFEFDLDTCCFDCGIEFFGQDETDVIQTAIFPIKNQLEIFQKLFEWHFDVFGLIEKGLAIDINTLNDLP